MYNIETKLFEKCILENSIGGSKSDKKSLTSWPRLHKLTCLSSRVSQQKQSQSFLFKQSGWFDFNKRNSIIAAKTEIKNSCLSSTVSQQGKR